MTLFEELKRRGLIAQMTNEEEIRKLLDTGKTTFYIGFDATADSLHVGHFLQLIVMKHMQLAGHTPIALLGTATTMIGDPTGKSDMRKMLTAEEINHNAECFRRQMEKFIEFGEGEGQAKIVRNGDWVMDLKYLDFLREVGVHFSVNRMLTAEAFKTRLERGLSFMEFNYMLLQSYDFVELHRKYGVMLELGGDDQWSNIINGVDLVRRMCGDEVFGMTFTLLTTKEGKKMGKTEKGALWLDPEKLSPYDFFQYWRNVDDGDVIRCMKLLTFLPIKEIEAKEHLQGSELNAVKEQLAFEVTKLVHGEEEASKALEAARSLFVSNADSSNMPSTETTKDQFIDDSIGLLDLLVFCGLCPSKAEARRLVQQGGISVQEEKVTDPQMRISVDAFKDGYIIIKKGKKVFHKVILA